MTEKLVIQKRSEDLVGDLADALVSTLLQRIKDGTATAADLSVAKDYIKSAGVKLIINKDTKAGELVDNLPSFDDQDDNIIQMPSLKIK